jgi:hypothetical protein
MKIKAQLLARIIVGALFAAVLAGTWDAWWHGAIGRDTPWELPHLFLYAATLCAIFLGVYGWWMYKEKAWKYVAWALLLIPISAPFDELWHRAFGVEDLSSPLIVWSLPHLSLIFALLCSLFLLLPLILKDKDVHARWMYGAIILAGGVSLLSFVLSPVTPTGPWELLGFWGAGLVAFVMIGGLLFAQKKIGGAGIATLVILFVIMLSAMSFGEEVAEDVEIIPHDHPSAWLSVFALLLPAVFLDSARQMKASFRGAIAGGLWAVLLYGFSSQFFEPVYQYGLSSVGVAVVASVGGGFVVGWLIEKKVEQSKISLSQSRFF